MSVVGVLALLDRDPVSGILAAAEDLQEETSRVSLGTGAFTGMTPDDSARLVEWMLAAVRRWRGAAVRHRHYISEPRLCANGCPGRYPCDDIIEMADEAKAYLGGAS